MSTLQVHDCLREAQVGRHCLINHEILSQQHKFLFRTEIFLPEVGRNLLHYGMQRRGIVKDIPHRGETIHFAFRVDSYL